MDTRPQACVLGSLWIDDALRFHSLELHIGIIAACIPTLRPLFSRTNRYPWNRKGWSRKLTGNFVQPHNEEIHRLHSIPQNPTVPTVPPGLDSGIGRSRVAVIAESRRHGFGVMSPRSGDSGDGLGGEADKGIMKKTEFSQHNRSDDEAVGWSQGNRKHREQESFNSV